MSGSVVASLFACAGRQEPVRGAGVKKGSGGESPVLRKLVRDELVKFPGMSKGDVYILRLVQIRQVALEQR